MMVTKVQKWGNSQGLRLSKNVLDLANIAIGDDVEIIVGDGQITVKKTGSKYDLAAARLWENVIPQADRKRNCELRIANCGLAPDGAALSKQPRANAPV